mgnify:CR=1 FL=1
MLLCGLFAGLAGSYISVAQNAGFTRDMTAGQGFIALAALIFGKWRPFSAFGACLMFGLLDAIAIRLQGLKLPGIGEKTATRLAFHILRAPPEDAVALAASITELRSRIRLCSLC